MTQDNHIDPLTGLNNRYCLQFDLTLDALEAGRKGEVLCKKMLCLDIENFQKFLDYQGFARADALLTELAQQLQSLFPEQKIYRVGGDEFVVAGVDVFPAALAEGWPVNLKHAVVDIQTSVETGRHHRATSWILLHIQQGIVCASQAGEVITCRTRDATGGEV